MMVEKEGKFATYVADLVDPIVNKGVEVISYSTAD